MQSEKAEIAKQFMLSVRFISQCTFEMLHIFLFNLFLYEIKHVAYHKIIAKYGIDSNKKKSLFLLNLNIYTLLFPWHVISSRLVSSHLIILIDIKHWLDHEMRLKRVRWWNAAQNWEQLRFHLNQLMHLDTMEKKNPRELG